jgi:hypothetical protein
MILIFPKFLPCLLLSYSKLCAKHQMNPSPFETGIMNTCVCTFKPGYNLWKCSHIIVVYRQPVLQGKSVCEQELRHIDVLVCSLVLKKYNTDVHITNNLFVRINYKCRNSLIFHTMQSLCNNAHPSIFMQNPIFQCFLMLF